MKKVKDEKKSEKSNNFKNIEAIKDVNSSEDLLGLKDENRLKDVNVTEIASSLDNVLSDLSPDDTRWQELIRAVNIRKKKKLFKLRTIAACLLIILSVGIVGQTTGIFPLFRLSGSLPGKFTGGGNSTASMIAMVYIDGKTYESTKSRQEEIKPGKKIAVVEEFTGEMRQRSKEEYEALKTKVFSTIVPVGGIIYALNDYDPDFRVVAKSSYGDDWIVFQRRFDSSTIGKFSEYVNIKGKIKSIILTDNYPREKGRIDDPDEIARLESVLSKEAAFSGKPWENAGTISERIYLEFKDGTQLEGPLSNGRLFLGTWLELPQEFLTTINQINLSQGGVPKNALGGGITVSREQGDRTGYTDAYIDVIDNNALFCSGAIWISNRTMVDSGPVRDVQGSPGKLWYINQSGNIIKADSKLADLDEYFRLFKGSAGNVLSDHVNKQTVFEGKASHIRVLDGYLFIQTGEGSLLMGNEIIAKNVTHFDIDYSSVIYTSGDDLYRLTVKDKKHTKLASASGISALSSAGHTVIYSTANGIYAVPVNGGNIKQLSKIAADKLICNGNGSIFAIETNTQALWKISFTGEIQKLRENGVIDFGLTEDNLILTVEKQKDGTMEMFRITLPQPGGDLLSRTQLLKR